MTVSSRDPIISIVLIVQILSLFLVHKSNISSTEPTTIDMLLKIVVCGYSCDIIKILISKLKLTSVNYIELRFIANQNIHI